MQEAVETTAFSVSVSPGRAESGESQDTRRIATRQFGEIEVHPRHIFRFADGLFGFEHLQEFVLIGEESMLPLRWLVSLDDSTIGFPLVSPFIIDFDYRLGKEHTSESTIPLVIVTLNNEAGRMTANMRAPVLLNVNEQSGRQIILSSERFSPEYPIGARSEQAQEAL